MTAHHVERDGSTQAASPGAAPRIALACVGIGRFQRGFERYFTDLFGVLRDSLDITLYKSAGATGPREKIPPMLALLTGLARRLPLGKVGTEYPQYKHDCLAFGVGMLPDLLRGRYDVVHVIDPPLVKVLQFLQRITGFRARLIWTDGCLWPPSLYPRNAHVHHVAQELYMDALSAGVPPSRVTLAPCGIHVERFATGPTRHDLRRKHGIAEATFVIAVVSAVRRDHKRVDHIIEEVAALEGDILLWIDGKPEDPYIPELAERRLGNRCRITFVASEQVGEIYQVADVFVHAALEESFGLAVVEALSTGVPVLVHDSRHFEWLVGERECLVDMRAPGVLRSRLAGLVANHGSAAGHSQARAAGVRSRFDWTAVQPRYLEMYRRAASKSSIEEPS